MKTISTLQTRMEYKKFDRKFRYCEGYSNQVYFVVANIQSSISIFVTATHPSVTDTGINFFVFW